MAADILHPPLSDTEQRETSYTWPRRHSVGARAEEGAGSPREARPLLSRGTDDDYPRYALTSFTLVS